MNYLKLNPLIRSVALLEKSGKGPVRIGYDSLVVYLCSGDLSYELGQEKKQHLTPGCLLFVPAGCPVRFSSRYFRAVAIRFDLTDEYAGEKAIPPATPETFDAASVRQTEDSAPFDRPIFLPDAESERDTFLAMANTAVSAEGNYLAELSARLKLILLKLAECAADDALPARMVENLDSYIRENAGDEISNTELGAIFGYHPFYISRMLKDKKGITLHQYVLLYRIKAAKAMLENTDRSVSDIAAATGFSDSSYFTKCFKAQTGVTPKEYRAGIAPDFL